MSASFQPQQPAGAVDHLRLLLSAAAGRTAPDRSILTPTDLVTVPGKPAWRHLGWIPAAPLLVIAGALLLPEIVLCGAGIVLSLIVFEWAKLTFRVLPPEVARRSISALVPAFGCYWKVEAFIDPVLRLFDDRELLEQLEHGRSSFFPMLGRLTLGLPMLFVLTVLKVTEQIWAAIPELWSAQLRQSFGLLGVRLIGAPVRPWGLYLRLALPFGLGELTQRVFAYEARRELLNDLLQGVADGANELS